MNNYLIVAVSLLCSISTLWAQQGSLHLDLDWEGELRKMQINKEQDYRYLFFKGAAYGGEDPRVAQRVGKVELPSFGSLSMRLQNVVTKEVALSVVQDLDLEEWNLGEEFVLRQHLSAEQGRPVANYTIEALRQNPSTKRYEQLVSADLVWRLAAGQRALSEQRNFKTTSVLASGDVYKMVVDQTGIHQIDYAFLQSLGVDVDNIDPRNIQIFGNGGAILTELINGSRVDDLEELAIEVSGEGDGRFNAGDVIRFYAKSTRNWTYQVNYTPRVYRHSQNYQTDESHYFIKIGNVAGKRVSSTASLSNTAYTTSSYDALGHYEFDEINVLETEFALPPSGRLWLGENFRNVNSQSFNFNFPNRISSEAMDIYTSMGLRAYSGGTIQYTANNTTISTKSFPGIPYTLYGQYADIRSLTESKLVGGGDNVSFAINYTGPSSSDAWLDFISLTARCALNFTGGQMPFRDRNSYAVGTASFSLPNNTAAMRVWNVTDPWNVVEQQLDVKASAAIFGVNVPADKLSEFVAFDQSNFYQPRAKGKVVNQNLHGTLQVPNVVYVYHPSVESAALRLANHRRSQGRFTVAAVNVEEIYNEFSSGNLDITAIRDYAKMLYDRSSGADSLQHLVLFGIGSYDYKNLSPDLDDSNNPRLIPVYQTRESVNTIKTYTTDDYFALLDDGEGDIHSADALDIGVGRLPVANLEEANAVVDKLIYYETSLDVQGDWKNRLCFVADDGDVNLHLDDAEYITNNVETRDSVYTVNKIYIDAYRQQTSSGGSRFPDANMAILDDFFKGNFVTSYLGHGGETGWAQERIFTSAEIVRMTNKDKMPLFITATCSFGPHDDAHIVSAAELLLSNKNGGGIALMSTVRVVFANANKRLANNTYARLFRKQNGQYPTLGEIIRQAKNAMGTDVDNTRKYALLGDPSMTLAYPDYTVRTNTINGQVISGADTVKALDVVTITGEVVDDQGQLMSNFNGVVYPTVYDKKDEVKTLANKPNYSRVTDFKVYKKIIFKGATQVQGGKFSFSFVVPKDINYTLDYGRISYYAKDASADEDAHGFYNGIVIGGTNQGAAIDEEGPIVRVFMNDTTFARGGVTDENPILLVKLYDDHGINTVGNSIGHDLTAQLLLSTEDEENYVLNDFYESETGDFKRGEVRYPLKDIPTGTHTIRVVAWDTYNNKGEGDTEFVVEAEADLALERVLNYPNPFTTSTNFQFEHNMPNKDLEVMVQIYTVGGRLVKTIQQEVSASENTGYRVDDIHWDGLDDFGDRIGKGVYIYKVVVQAIGDEETKKLKSKFEKLVILK